MSLKKNRAASRTSQFFIDSDSISQNGDNNFNSLVNKKTNSLRRQMELDTISESGFKLSRFNIGSIYRNRRKSRSNSININSISSNDEHIEIDGVMLFKSISNGICCKVSITKKNIVFSSETASKIDENLSDSKVLSPKFTKEFLTPKYPLHEDEFQNKYEVDLLNIGDVSRETSNDYYNIIIQGQNFKHIRLSIKQSPLADSFINRLNVISFKNMFQQQQDTYRACLWEYLFNNYKFKTMSDWKEHEKWFSENFKMRFSQFNDNGQCNSLPETIIVPMGVQERQLETILNISCGHRVPVITYLHRNSSNIIIRATVFNETCLQTLCGNSIQPLRDLDIHSILPPKDDVMKHYLKLRKACFNVVQINKSKSASIYYDVNYSKQFWSKCGLWLGSLSKVLKFTIQLVNILLFEASIGLSEPKDSDWNCVLSSLVQVFVDPYRRTIKGFESLLSKEWVYLSGYKSRQGENKTSERVFHVPSVVMFVFFLDLVHQVMAQNPYAFEFTTVYLVSLMDSQFVTELYTREKAAQFLVNNSHSSIRNPLYMKNNKPVTVVSVKTHITQMRLFSILYLRHITSDTMFKHTPEENMFLQELHNRNLL